MLIPPRRLIALLAGCALAPSGCGRQEEAAAPSESSDAEASPEASAAEPAAAPAPVRTAPEVSGLIAATRDYAETGCSAARRRLEYCAACEGPEQKPLRDLLLAYCKQRDSGREARALYEDIITNHPGTFASVAAIMHVRQLDAAELPPLGDYAGPKPKPLDRPQPAYPPLADAARLEGKVRVRFDVRDDGGVANVRVVESAPPLLFDAVALYAVNDWRYEPGQPAQAQQVTLRFDLPESAASPAPPAEAAQ